MTLNGRNLADNSVGPTKLFRDLALGRYVFDSFMMQPFVTVKGEVTDALTPLGTSLVGQLFNTGRNVFEYYFAGTATDVFVPVLGTDGGYIWTFGDALQGGVEINFGGTLTGHPRNFTPRVTGGGGEDWFARILLIVDDASGLDAFLGFRKVATTAATLTEYSDVFGVRILGNSGSTDAIFQAVTNLNNAGATDYSATTLSATGLEDATAVEIEVRSQGGVGKAFVNGVEYGGFGTYTFDLDDVMCPVFRGVQTTDVFAQLKVLAYEAGPLACRQDASLASLAGATA